MKDQFEALILPKVPKVAEKLKEWSEGYKVVAVKHYLLERDEVSVYTIFNSSFLIFLS